MKETNRKIKKWVSAALTFAMVMAVMVGCSPSTKAPGPDDSSDPGYVEFTDPNDFSSSMPKEDSGLAIHYLPQGYAIAQSGNQTVLLDGCAEKDADAVITYLKDEMSVERLSQIIVPNMDPSRYGGVKALMDAIPTALVIVPNVERTEEFSAFTESIGGGMTVVPLRTGNTFNIGTNLVTIVGPIVEESENSMDTSLMLRITCGDKAFLFTNDASQAEAETLLTDSPDLKADIIFANSRNTTSLPYSVLRLISPTYEVIAEHTSIPDTSEFNMELHDTNEGAVVVTCDGETISFGF